MKLSILYLFLFFANKLFSQVDTSAKKLIFFDDFDDNRNGWSTIESKYEIGKIEGGSYYITAKGHAYGDAKIISIDTKQDFEIEASIKMVSGGTSYKDYNSMLFWGRDSLNAYYFTFAKDSYAAVTSCMGIKARDCTIFDGSLQKSNLNPDEFNKFTIRKIKRTYYFLINDIQFYKMPFVPFFGNNIGMGAGRKSTIAVDYLRVAYL